MALECLHLFCKYFNAFFSFFHNWAFSLFSEIGKKTALCRPIRSVIRVLVKNKLDSCCAVIRFCYQTELAPLSSLT